MGPYEDLIRLTFSEGSRTFPLDLFSEVRIQDPAYPRSKRLRITTINPTP